MEDTSAVGLGVAGGVDGRAGEPGSPAWTRLLDHSRGGRKVSIRDPKVFISYRREDTAGHAGRLYDTMAARFGEGNVFVDVDLAPGIDFVQRITEAVGACRVLLVMIGPRWAVITNDDSRPRLADPEDFVRLEVETALRRAEVTVIPVLVAGAQMPDPDDLPEGLRPLTRRNALELSDGRWRYDVGRLNATLDELLADPSAAHAATTSTATTRLQSVCCRRPRIVVDGMLIAGLAALIGRLIADPISPQDLDQAGAQIATAILRRTVTWAVLGVALAAWLTFIQGDRRVLAKRVLLGLGLGALAGALGGAVIFVPQYLPSLDLSSDTLDNISIAAFAVSGALTGVLVGALWIPRSIAAGLLAGLVAGAAIRLLWIHVPWHTHGHAVQESLQLGIQCMLIVGVVLGTLQLLSTQHQRSALEEAHSH